ncbi:MAG: hypothetical protein ACYDAB_04700 [bacterium]
MTVDCEVYYHGAAPLAGKSYEIDDFAAMCRAAAPASRGLAGAVMLREFAAISGGDLPRSTPIRTEAT